MKKTLSVSEAPIPLILRKIHKKKLSGTISIMGENFKKRVYFGNGSILYADTNLVPERLGEILFRSEKLSRKQFLSIHKLIKGAKKKIGKLLVENKILSEKDIYHGVRLQVRLIVLSLFSISSAKWSFEEKFPDLPDDSKFNIDLSAVIYEGTVKHIQNINFYKARNNSKYLKINEMSGNVESMLPKTLIYFHKKLITFGGTSNKDIVDELEISESEYWSNLLPLYFLGIVDFEDVHPKVEDKESMEKIIGLYDKINTQKINYYDVLGLGSDASAEDIRDAYFDYAKKYHPDRITITSDAGLKDKANFVFSEINRAYDTLSDENKRHKYNINELRANSDGSSDLDKSLERASMLHRKAKTLFNQKNYWEATTLLEEATRLNPQKGSYFLLLGMSQMNIPSMIRSAEKNLTKSASLDEWKPEPLIALGVLFLNENMTKRAESFFRKALSIDPENKVANKKLQEIEGSSTKRILKRSIFKKK